MLRKVRETRRAGINRKEERTMLFKMGKHVRRSGLKFKTVIPILFECEKYEPERENLITTLERNKSYQCS